MTLAHSFPTASQGPRLMLTASTEGPMKYCPKVSANHPKRDDSLGERLSTFLRRECPTKTADTVAADLGISRSTVAAWLKTNAAPNGEALASLIELYGLRLLAAILPDARWLDDAFQAERLAQLQADHERIGREIEALRR